MQFRLLIFFQITLLLSCSYSDKKQQPDKTRSPLKSEENLIRANRYLIQKDKEIIENYIERHSLDMKQTQSGLWYTIISAGDGPKPSTDQKVSYVYQISLLDGTVCYQNDTTNPKEIILGKGGVESGLEEGLLLLREGSKAKFIMPPHLAHGLVGDDHKIPPRAIIVYDVELLEILN